MITAMTLKCNLNISRKNTQELSPLHLRTKNIPDINALVYVPPKPVKL